MKTVKAKKLKKGDTIGLLALSGVVEDTKEPEIAKKRLEKSGYNVVLSKTNYTKDRYMCADKIQCVKELKEFFENPKIDAIISTRGGYGTLRFLNDIDYSIIKNNPKIFVGFSDITNLLAMFYKKAGLIGFYGPMALSDFGSEFDEISYNSMFDILEGKVESITADNLKTINEGTSKGVLWGGNLSSLASLCGIDFIPDEKFILFIEDWHDPIYKIDRMMTQLLNIKKFKSNLCGIAIGEFLGIDNEDDFISIFEEISKEYKIPICQGFKITHGKAKLTVPYGINVTFKADSGEIKFNEEYIL